MNAQEKQSQDSTLYVKVKGDTLFTDALQLDEVFLFNKLSFSSSKDKMAYYILRRKTYKVYPYAKIAADRLVGLRDTLSFIKGKRKQKRYTKKVQKYIEGEFSARLKKMTRTEGQILVKLVHRQTGETAFDLVKELRTGWRAFWYNTTASFFDISLKEEYQPNLVHEDYLIEDVLQRAFADGALQRQDSKLSFNYADLSNKWYSQDKKK